VGASFTPGNMAHQSSRYELKFIIDERCACGVRDFLRGHLRRDVHARPALRYSYPIYSVYFDCPGLSLYRATVQGQKNRYKLRVRYYDHDDAHPVYFEIKRRVGDVVIKDRASVRRESLERLLARHSARRSDLVDPDDANAFWILSRFCELRNAIHAEPKMVVYYLREAWVSPTDEDLRVTFDREAGGSYYDGTLSPSRWGDPNIEGVILELKFDERFPLWMRELAQNWDLYRTRMGKYFFCMERLPRPRRRMSTAV